MKKIIVFLTTSLLSFTCFAQKNQSATPEDLLEKSRKSMVSGIVCATSGPLIALGGGVTLLYGLTDTYTDDNITSSTYGDTKFKHENAIYIGGATIIAGAAIAVLSTAYFSKAHKFRQLAKAKLRATTETIMINKIGNGFSYSPTKQLQLTLTIPFGK